MWTNHVVCLVAKSISWPVQVALLIWFVAHEPPSLRVVKIPHGRVLLFESVCTSLRAETILCFTLASGGRELSVRMLIFERHENRRGRL